MMEAKSINPEKGKMDKTDGERSGVPEEYNIVGRITGIGPEVFLSLIRECRAVEDVQSIVGVNKQTLSIIRDVRLLWATLPARAHKWSLIGAASAGEKEIAEWRIEVYGDNPNMQDGVGGTPLYVASEKGHLSIVEYLVSH